MSIKNLSAKTLLTDLISAGAEIKNIDLESFQACVNSLSRVRPKSWDNGYIPSPYNRVETEEELESKCFQSLKNELVMIVSQKITTINVETISDNQLQEIFRLCAEMYFTVFENTSFDYYCYVVNDVIEVIIQNNIQIRLAGLKEYKQKQNRVQKLELNAESFLGSLLKHNGGTVRTFLRTKQSLLFDEFELKSFDGLSELNKR
jgi:hypothetical protein